VSAVGAQVRVGGKGRCECPFRLVNGEGADKDNRRSRLPHGESQSVMVMMSAMEMAIPLSRLRMAQGSKVGGCSRAQQFASELLILYVRD
jgi:hypothetical protein